VTRQRAQGQRQRHKRLENAGQNELCLDHRCDCGSGG
jgi:hypothetical protein